MVRKEELGSSGRYKVKGHEAPSHLIYSVATWIKQILAYGAEPPDVFNMVYKTSGMTNGPCPKRQWVGGCAGCDVLGVLFTAKLWHWWSVSLSTPACRGPAARVWAFMGILLSWPVHLFGLATLLLNGGIRQASENCSDEWHFLLLLFETSSSKTPSGCSLLAQAT